MLRVVPCRDKLGNVGEGLALGDQELMRLSVEEEVGEQFQIFESACSDNSLPVIVAKRTLLAMGCLLASRLLTRDKEFTQDGRFSASQWAKSDVLLAGNRSVS